MQGPQSQPPWHCALRMVLRSETRLFETLHGTGKGRRAARALRLGDRGAEADGDDVVAGLQHAGHVDAVADERGFGIGDDAAVDRHHGDGVDEIEFEHRPASGKGRRVDGKRAPDLPFGFGDPLDFGLVGADERIGDAAERHQRRVDVAGDRAGADDRAVGVVERPRSGKRQMRHRNPLMERTAGRRRRAPVGSGHLSADPWRDQVNGRDAVGGSDGTEARADGGDDWPDRPPGAIVPWSARRRARGEDCLLTYIADNGRYGKMTYRRSGRSGIDLPEISLGLWQNFGGVDNFEVARAILRRAFDRGVTHFDLANNYGPPYGSAEENFGRIFAADFRPYRDELFISSKAGWDMWPGPYGNLGSRKYLIASLDQSLKRMGLDYVDIFYHHRPDPNTPIEEIDGRARFDRPPGQGALCRHLELFRGPDAEGGGGPRNRSARPASSTSRNIRC